MTNGANAALAAWFGAQNCYLDMAAMRPARRLVRRAATCRNADSPRTVANDLCVIAATPQRRTDGMLRTCCQLAERL